MGLIKQASYQKGQSRDAVGDGSVPKDADNFSAKDSSR